MAFPHVSRQPESIIFHDRDVIAYIPDRLKDDITGSFQIYDKASGVLLYEVSSSNLPDADNRVLLTGRTLSNGVLANGLHCCIYKTGVSATDAKVLREIISPRVTYQRDSNVVVMWFWTNFEEDVTEYTDEEGKLYWIDEDNFDESKEVIRALCCTVGYIERRYRVGGLIQNSGGANGFDLVTVFEKPTILMKRPQPEEAGDPMGVPIIDFTAGGAGGGLLYRATENQSGSTIRVRAVAADGSTTGPTITLQVVT